MVVRLTGPCLAAGALPSRAHVSAASGSRSYLPTRLVARRRGGHATVGESAGSVRGITLRAQATRDVEQQ